MREILFRGKRIIGGEWVYGSLLTDNSGEKHIIPFEEIYMDGHHVCIESDWPQFFDQQTIGQFTGLHDKNGVEIFEGDIYTTFGSQKYEIRFINGSFCGGLLGGDDSIFAPLGWKSPEGDEEVYLSNEIFNIMKIIGNVHDNPEFLESK